MYRKSMREALAEARAYTAVNEVKVSKGGKTLSISKKDVEVYQAKGWSLQEANMKRILQALQDKLSDEGGAAGFDDLKKTAKSMGLNLTPAMLKDMPGIKQHRDGDYILEELEEAKKYKVGDKVKYDGSGYQMGKYKNQIATITYIDFAPSNFGKGAPNHFIKFKDGKEVISYPDEFKEELDKDDKETIKPIIKQLQKSVKTHDKQAKQLQKDIEDEKDLEEAIGMTGGSRMLEYFVKYRMGPGDKFNTQGPFTLRDAVKFKRSVESKGGQAQVTQNPFEETQLGEATPVPPRDLMLTYGKPGEKVKAYYTKFMQDLQNKAHELRKKGFVVDKMGLTQPMSKLRDRIPEEINTDTYADSKKKMLNKEGTELVEFTLADYRELESDNQHDIAAKKLIDKFGTSQEKSTINDINRRHAKTGYISGTDFRLRTMIVNRYYSRLK